MVGTFFRNRKNELCFAQVSNDEDIAAFYYAVTTKMIRAIMANGAEETIPADIGSDVHDILFPAQRLRVATLDPNGEPEREYWADITVGES
jgi:hypothetical protein